VRARIRTTVPLTDERRRLSAKLGRALGGRYVVLEEVVDPTMLGGFVVESGSMVFALMRHRLASGEEARRKVLPVALSMLGLSTMLLGNWWTPMAVPVCQIGAGSCARTWLSWRWRTAMVKCATCKRELTAVVRENVSGDSNLRFAIRPRGGAYVARFASPSKGKQDKLT
jgi:ATP synthase delta (OSCP) subunit